MNEAEIQQEVKWIDNEGAWPLWPVLPVKNVNRGQSKNDGLGILVANERGKRTLWRKNLFDLQSGPLLPQLEGIESKVYDSTEALVRDGWVGD